MKYVEIKPIEKPIVADRQGAKRHYGVHPYFTRRPYNVVSRYIQHYSNENDRVLDPFGGSGVTAIEAFLHNRIGIQNDINPLANFIAKGIADLSIGNIDELRDGLTHVIDQCGDLITTIYNSDEAELKNLLADLSLPEDVILPKSSDVIHYHELFSGRQLAALAVLKRSIESIMVEHVRNSLLLAWSASLAKLNKTFLSSEGRAESRGGSSIFSIYRYKVAKAPVDLPAMETFKERATNVINAKREIQKIVELRKRQNNWVGKFETYADDVEDLSEKLADSIDYIFTDPPYGGHISYLDLSTLWNVWLGTTPSIEVRENELIVGGELALGEKHYIEKLTESIAACMKMLKTGRWISIVFQHWNVRYFEAILSAVNENKGELRSAVSQIGDPIWSMHKKKNKDSVLAGEMILTFFKNGSRIITSNVKKFDLEANISEMLKEANGSPIFGEYLFNRIVLEAWRTSAIESLDVSKSDFSRLLEEKGWHYDPVNHFWVKNGGQPALLF